MFNHLLFQISWILSRIQYQAATIDARKTRGCFVRSRLVGDLCLRRGGKTMPGWLEKVLTAPATEHLCVLTSCAELSSATGACRGKSNASFMILVRNLLVASSAKRGCSEISLHVFQSFFLSLCSQDISRSCGWIVHFCETCGRRLLWFGEQLTRFWEWFSKLGVLHHFIDFLHHEQSYYWRYPSYIFVGILWGLLSSVRIWKLQWPSYDLGDRGAS